MEGDLSAVFMTILSVISIHSLRMEGDDVQRFPDVIFRISIHSLRMEGDRKYNVTLLLMRKFQSTPSAWRETAGFLLGGVIL